MVEMNGKGRPILLQERAWGGKTVPCEFLACKLSLRLMDELPELPSNNEMAFVERVAEHAQLGMIDVDDVAGSVNLMVADVRIGQEFTKSIVPGVQHGRRDRLTGANALRVE